MVSKICPSLKSNFSYCVNYASNLLTKKSAMVALPIIGLLAAAYYYCSKRVDVSKKQLVTQPPQDSSLLTLSADNLKEGSLDDFYSVAIKQIESNTGEKIENSTQLDEYILFMIDRIDDNSCDKKKLLADVIVIVKYMAACWIKYKNAYENCFGGGVDKAELFEVRLESGKIECFETDFGKYSIESFMFFENRYSNYCDLFASGDFDEEKKELETLYNNFRKVLNDFFPIENIPTLPETVNRIDQMLTQNA